MRALPWFRPALRAFALSAAVAGAAACAPVLEVSRVVVATVVGGPAIVVSHPTTGVLEASSECAEAHVQEPLILTATDPAGPRLEAAGAWGDDRLQHARQTRLQLSLGNGRVATVGADNHVNLWDTTTGALLAHVDLEGEPERAVASRAGDVFVVDGRGMLVGMDGASGAVRFHTLLPERSGGLAMSADERHAHVDGRLDYRVDAAPSWSGTPGVRVSPSPSPSPRRESTSSSTSRPPRPRGGCARRSRSAATAGSSKRRCSRRTPRSHSRPPTMAPC